MIHSNYSTHTAGQVHNRPTDLTQPQQTFPNRFNSGGSSPLLALLNLLISQLLQQLSASQNAQQQNSHCCHGQNSHHGQGSNQGHGHAQGAGRQRVQSAEVFNTPTGATEPGPALSGQAYEFNVDARRGQNVSFATMLAATNDQFIAPDSNGIPLYDRWGNPREGDITHLLSVWDAGTEANEPVGSGANQPSNQSGPNTGPADPQNYVRRSDEGVGPVDHLVKATLHHNGNGNFTVSIENISAENGGNEIPITPGIVATHRRNANPFFSDMRMDRGQGLEALAEDGDPSQLLASLQARQRMY